MREKAEFSLGREGEAVVRQWLKEQGNWVVPTALIEHGGAPALESWLQRLILPDSLVSKQGKSRWVEVKTKTRATFNQKRQRWEHGIPLKHWHDYRKVEELTGICGSLAILQLDERKILLGTMEEIATSAFEYLGGKMSRGGMVFFDTRLFQWVDYDSRKPLPKGSLPNVVQPWEKREPPKARQLPLL